jgi:hypothetical protein
MSGRAGRDLTGDAIAKGAFGAFPVVVGLEVGSAVGANAETPDQPKRRFRSYRALAGLYGRDYVVHAALLVQGAGLAPLGPS